MDPLIVAIYIASIFLTAAVFLALVRVLIGPTLPNRMMSVDLVAMRAVFISDCKLFQVGFACFTT